MIAEGLADGEVAAAMEALNAEAAMVAPDGKRDRPAASPTTSPAVRPARIGRMDRLIAWASGEPQTGCGEGATGWPHLPRAD